MNVEELKQEINNLTKEEIGEVAEFCNDLYDTVDD